MGGALRGTEDWCGTYPRTQLAKGLQAGGTVCLKLVREPGVGQVEGVERSMEWGMGLEWREQDKGPL